MQTGDDEVLALAAGTDTIAFTELYRRYQHRVYGYLLARVGNVQDAQDLTAQTFLAALEGIGGYRGQGSFAAWLFGIGRRKAARHFQNTRELLSLEAATDFPDPAPPLDEAVRRRMQLEQVVQAMQALAPERAEALSLRLFARLSAAEIAEVMGKSEAAVRMLVHRAMRDVQERLVIREGNT